MSKKYRELEKKIPPRKKLEMASQGEAKARVHTADDQ